MTSRVKDFDWSGWVRYGIPGVALGVALACSLGGREPAARAEGPIPMPISSAERSRGGAPAGETASVGSGSVTGTFAFTAPAAGNAQMLYLIDTKAKAFVVYKVDPNNPKGTVKLEAARQYQWDLKLSEYNNLEPGVASIESMVKSLGQERR